MLLFGKSCEEVSDRFEGDTTVAVIVVPTTWNLHQLFWFRGEAMEFGPLFVGHDLIGITVQQQ